MKNQQFDRLLSEVRDEKVGEDVINDAARRVLTSIAAANSSADPVPHTLRSCADFQALRSAYRDGTLSPARVLLMEDHLHGCVECRHAMEGTDRHRAPRATGREIGSGRRPVLRWAAALALVVGIAIGILAGAAGLLPGQHAARATVESVDGSLYDATNAGNRLIPAGYKVGDGDEVRTAKASRAEVRLADGSRIEVGERSQFSLSHGWRGTTIHLDGGTVIVQAAKQHASHLYVATDDCLVSAKGTIFLVNHGIKGSRVSVLEGVVNVAYGQHMEDLQAGDETTTNSNLARVPLQDEIAWSKNAAKYLALLGEFQTLQKQFEAIPEPGLRYQSDLLQYLPDNTVVYAAIPNIGPTLSEGERVFEDRLQQSPVLRAWWKQQQRGHGEALQDMINKIETFSSYLGSEVVLAVAQNGSQSYAAPVLLADVRQPGLREFLEQQNSKLSAGQTRDALRIVDNPAAVPLGPNSSWLVYLNHGLMVATFDPVQLQRTAAVVDQPQTRRFTQTPFFQKITQSYQDGVGWLFCVDMEQIISDHVPDQRGGERLPPGFGDVKYLVVERRDVGKTETRASVTFAPQRKGVAAWLAAPAPMGSLNFVSPDASLAASLVIKDPRSMMEEIFEFAENSDPNFRERLSDFESKVGVSFLNDVSAPLGGEVAVALDGPALPVPSWKVIVEVYDRDTLQSTITKLVESFNRQASPKAGRLQLAQQQIGPQTYYTLLDEKRAGWEIDYTFVDSYLIAAPSRSLLARAIQNRQTGYTLTHSPGFQAQLPSDGYTNFSAIFYHNLTPLMTPLAEQLKAMRTLSPDEQHELDALPANSAPGLIYAYGEPDRIVVASSSGFMGLSLDTLLAIGQGQPVLLSQLFGSGAGPGMKHTHERSGNTAQKP
jgi:ferric-dicitrate binding protein FerR (iron transport regulator)